MNWRTLIDETALAAVLPSDRADLARPIRDALAKFLQLLPQQLQAALLDKQLRLPPPASISQRLVVLAGDCPVLQKLGQVLARDQRLAPELRRHLQTLESLPPTVPLATIRATLERELGPLDRLNITLAPPALAEASVAVVIPFRKHGQRTSGEPRHGVFKILKPGIEERLELELAILEQVGSHLDQQCDQLGIPQLDYQETFQQVRDKLREEIQLENEQRHLVQARTVFADQPRVQIPRLMAYCTSRITAMERILGDKITAPSLAQPQNRQLAQVVIRALIAQPVLSRADQALFHGDPHAGNLFLTPGGRLAILDWSLVGCLGQEQRESMTQILLAAVTLNSRRITTILQGLADRPALDEALLQRVVGDWVRRVRYGTIPGLVWLVGMLDQVVQTTRLRLSSDMLLFRKSLHTLQGVLAAIGADPVVVDAVLCGELLRRFLSEWPGRWFARPTSRSFSIRLSNVELTQLAMSGPITLARFWMDQLRDVAEIYGAACHER